jgi:D-inositol-3-phosphate glycosyltransferase
MTTYVPPPSVVEEGASLPVDGDPTQARLDATLLTGGQDRHYSFGLATALASRGVCLDIIGSDEVDSPELHDPPTLNFLNLRGRKEANASRAKKLSKVLLYYARLVRYAATARPKVFHVLWNNKFERFDRTVLMSYYKLLGKNIVFTAHNVNIGRRDSRDSFLNRFTLKFQYRLIDHFFVHTETMKRELCDDFEVPERKVTVLVHPLNVAIRDSGLSSREAKERLGLTDGNRTILFFGAIAPYKGLDLLVEAFRRLACTNSDYRLIVAGHPKGGCDQYLRDVQQTINRTIDRKRVIEKIEYVSDEDTELYFKAADLVVLPYRNIYQSGVLFLAYSFGLPVVVTDVGCFKETMVEGSTGFVCKPDDPDDLANTIEKYFESDLFHNLGHTRHQIRDYANARHSWDAVGEVTRNIYARLTETN